MPCLSNPRKGSSSYKSKAQYKTINNLLKQIKQGKQSYKNKQGQIRNSIGKHHLRSSYPHSLKMMLPTIFAAIPKQSRQPHMLVHCIMVPRLRGHHSRHRQEEDASRTWLLPASAARKVMPFLICTKVSYGQSCKQWSLTAKSASKQTKKASDARQSQVCLSVQNCFLPICKFNLWFDQLTKINIRNRKTAILNSAWRESVAVNLVLLLSKHV